MQNSLSFSLETKDMQNSLSLSLETKDMQNSLSLAGNQRYAEFVYLLVSAPACTRPYGSLHHQRRPSSLSSCWASLLRSVCPHALFRSVCPGLPAATAAQPSFTGPPCDPSPGSSAVPRASVELRAIPFPAPCETLFNSVRSPPRHARLRTP